MKDSLGCKSQIDDMHAVHNRGNHLPWPLQDRDKDKKKRDKDEKKPDKDEKKQDKEKKQGKDKDRHKDEKSRVKDKDRVKDRSRTPARAPQQDWWTAPGNQHNVTMIKYT